MTLQETIEKLGNERKYKEQGEVFLKETGTTLEVLEAVPQRLPIWKEEKDIFKVNPVHYSVTLKNKRGAYTFDFWGSVHDSEIIEKAEEVNSLQREHSPLYFYIADFLKEETGQELKRGDLMNHKVVERVKEAVKPGAYDIFACLSPMSEETFQDWCDSLGYDSDSIRAEKIYNACIEQDRNMRRLFTHEEIDALSCIA